MDPKAQQIINILQYLKTQYHIIHCEWEYKEVITIRFQLLDRNVKTNCLNYKNRLKLINKKTKIISNW